MDRKTRDQKGLEALGTCAALVSSVFPVSIWLHHLLVAVWGKYLRLPPGESGGRFQAIVFFESLAENSLLLSAFAFFFLIPTFIVHWRLFGVQRIGILWIVGWSLLPILFGLDPGRCLWVFSD